MSEQTNDAKLLNYVNLWIRKNLATQKLVEKCIKVIPERINKAKYTYNIIMNQRQYVEWLKQEIKFQDSQNYDNIYFYRYEYSKSQPTGWFYYRYLEKMTENQKEYDNQEEADLIAFEENRLNKAWNTLTADMIDFSENSSISNYKKRQRHQLSQKFKSKNRHKLSKNEDETLRKLIEKYRDSKINWKLLTMEFNQIIGSRNQRTIFEVYKRYQEIKQASEIVWTEEENQRLRNMISKHGTKNNWFQISMNFDTKNSYNWFMQYKKLIDNNIK